MIHFQCSCGEAMGAPDDYAGRKGKCSKCGNAVLIPNPAPVVPLPVPLPVPSKPSPPPMPTTAIDLLEQHAKAQVEISRQSLNELKAIRGNLGCMFWMLVFMIISGFVAGISVVNSVNPPRRY